jgi:hypothetical protein
MLSKLVSSVATSSTKKTDAESALAKQQKLFDDAKADADVATDEYITANLQAEKEKMMIGHIRAMVTRFCRLLSVYVICEPDPFLNR